MLRAVYGRFFMPLLAANLAFINALVAASAAAVMHAINFIRTTPSYLMVTETKRRYPTLL